MPCPCTTGVKKKPIPHHNFYDTFDTNELRFIFMLTIQHNVRVKNGGKMQKLRVLIVAVVLCFCSYLLATEPINQGLDIQGGTHFTLQVMTDNMQDSEKIDAVDRAIAVIRNRINAIGIAETVVQEAEKGRIIVQAPGVDSEDADRIKGILKRQAYLEFKLVVDGPGKPIIKDLDKPKRNWI
jgi:SecD/SecF fusion protein